MSSFVMLVFFGLATVAFMSASDLGEPRGAVVALLAFKAMSRASRTRGINTIPHAVTPLDLDNPLTKHRDAFGECCLAALEGLCACRE